MKRHTLPLKTMGLALLLAVLLALGAAALAEVAPIHSAKYSTVVTPQEDIWVQIPKDAKAASWDVSLWDISDGYQWKRLYNKDNVTAAGKVTLETAGKLSAGAYQLRVTQYDAKDRETEYWGRVVTVFDKLPASGTATLTLASAKGSTGGDTGVSVYAPGAVSGFLVFGTRRVQYEGDYFGDVISFSEDGEAKVYAIVTYADGSTKTTAKQTVTVSESGSLGAWKPTGLPSGAIGKSAGVSLHIPRVANADKILSNGKSNIYYFVSIWDMDAETSVYDVNYREKLDPGNHATTPLIGSGVDVKIDASALTAGHNYECFVQAMSYGHGCIYEMSYFNVKGSADEKLTLSINDQTSGTLNMGCGEEFEIKVNIPSGATALRIYCGDHFEYMNYWGEWEDRWTRLGEVQMGWSVWEHINYQFYAQAYYKAIPEGTELESLKWGAATSNVVNVTGENGTFLPTPTVKLSNTSVARGENLTVTITDMGEGAEGVDAEVYGQNVEGEFYDFRMSGSKIQIPTASMAPGTYVVRVSNYAAGRWGNATYAAFQVTAPTAAGKPTLSLSSTKLSTHEQVRISAYAEGAQHIDIRLYRPNGDREDDRGYDGESVDDWFGGWGDAETFTVVARADYGDKTAETTKTFTVSAAKGTLKSPTVKSAPKELKVGEDATVKFSVDSKAGWVYIDLHRISDDGEWFYLLSEDVGADTTSYTFDGSLFSEPGTYRIGINASQEGYESSYAEVRLRVVKKTAKATIKLTINGSDSATTFQAFQNVPLTIEAPGATAVRLYRDDGGWDYWSKDDHPSSIKSDTSFGMNVVFTAFAQACYEDYDQDADGFEFEKLNWSGVSNGVAVTVTTPNGKLARPTAKLSADSVKRGGKLTVTVTPQKISGKTPIYWADIEREYDEDDREWLYHIDMDTSTNTIAIPTAMLVPGNYRAYIQVECQGYSNSNSMLRFTITKPSSSLKQVQLTLSATKVKTCEDIRAYVFAEGADWTEIRVTMKGNSEWQEGRNGGERDGHWFMFTRKGTYTFTPYGHYGDKEVAGDAVKLTVTSSGSVAAPKVTLPSVITFGQPLEASFKKSSGAEYYATDLAFCPRDGDWEFIVGWEIKDGSTALVYNADCLDRPGIYTLYLEGRAVGKEMKETREFFAVVDPEKILTLPAGLKTIGEEAFEGAAAQLIVVPEGVTSIGSRAFADCPDLMAVIIPKSVKKVADNAFEGCRDDLIRATSW